MSGLDNKEEQLPYLRRTVLGMATLAAIAAGAIAVASASASTHAQAASSKYSVVYIPGLTGNPFYSTVACGAAVEAKKLGDVSFSTQGAATFAVNAQTPIVEAVTARHPTAIMISNDDPTAMIPPLLKAQRAGIKIINIDGDLTNLSVGVTNIQSDDLLGGQEAGEEMAELTKDAAGTVLIEDNSRRRSCRSFTRTTRWLRRRQTSARPPRRTRI